MVLFIEWSGQTIKDRLKRDYTRRREFYNRPNSKRYETKYGNEATKLYEYTYEYDDKIIKYVFKIIYYLVIGVVIIT